MKRKAFSLVELLIAAALTATLLVIVFWSLGNFLKQYHRLVLTDVNNQLKAAVLTRIIKDLRANLPVKYSLVDGRVRREAGGRADYLTDYREVKVFSLREIGPHLKEVILDDFTVKIAQRN